MFVHSSLLANSKYEWFWARRKKSSEHLSVGQREKDHSDKLRALHTLQILHFFSNGYRKAGRSLNFGCVPAIGCAVSQTSASNSSGYNNSNITTATTKNNIAAAAAAHFVHAFFIWAPTEVQQHQCKNLFITWALEMSLKTITTLWIC